MRTICRVSLVVGFVAIGILGTQLASAAPVDPTLSVQGVLRKADGTVAADGTYDLAFRFYAAATGGAALKLVDSKGVPVKRGVFAVTLDLGDKALVTSNASLWVGVTVGGDTVELPRQRLVPTAYALQAEHANSADTATSATSADTAKTAASADTAKTATSCDTAKSASALMCTACVAAEAVSFNYAASATKGGAATDLACSGCVSSNEIAACADGQILKFVGTAWTCAPDAAGTVTSVGATTPLASSGGATPTISLTGIVSTANGGTGLSSSGSAGNYLRSDGTSWKSASIAAADLPAGSAKYIQNIPPTGTAQAADLNISGAGAMGSLSVSNAATVGGRLVGMERIQTSRDSGASNLGFGEVACTAQMGGSCTFDTGYQQGGVVFLREIYGNWRGFFGLKMYMIYGTSGASEGGLIMQMSSQTMNGNNSDQATLSFKSVSAESVNTWKVDCPTKPGGGGTCVAYFMRIF